MLARWNGESLEWEPVNLFKSTLSIKLSRSTLKIFGVLQWKEGKTNMHFNLTRFGGSAGYDAGWEIEFSLKTANTGCWEWQMVMQLACSVTFWLSFCFFILHKRHSCWLIHFKYRNPSHCFCHAKNQLTWIQFNFLQKIMTIRHAFLQF